MIRSAASCSIAALVLASCGLDRATSPMSPEEPLWAKAPAPVSTEWVIEDLAGLASDGLGAYVDGACGVTAWVYTSNGGNAQLRPAGARSRCGFVRTVSLAVGSLALHPEGLGAIGIWGIPAGTTAGVDFNINTGTGSCALLKYNTESGAPVQVTAGTTTAGKRTWLIESTGTHSAGCYVFQNGGFVWDGVQRTVPLRISITAR